MCFTPYLQNSSHETAVYISEWYALSKRITNKDIVNIERALPAAPGRSFWTSAWRCWPVPVSPSLGSGLSVPGIWSYWPTRSTTAVWAHSDWKSRHKIRRGFRILFFKGAVKEENLKNNKNCRIMHPLLSSFHNSYTLRIVTGFYY